MPADEHVDKLTSDQTRPLPPRYWWLKRLLVAVMLLLVAALVLRGLVGVVAQRRLDAHVAKLRAAGEPMLRQDFEFPSVADEDNAAIRLKEAAELLVEPGKNDVALAGFLQDPTLIDSNEEAVRAILHANEEPLRLLGEARFKAGVDWGNRFSSPMLTIDTIRPMDHARLEGLAQLGCLAALHAWRRDEHAKAFERLLDVLDLANRLNEGHPLVLTSLVGTVACRDASDVLECIASVPIRSPAQGRQAIAVLLDEGTLAAGFTEAYRVERAGLLDAVPGMRGADILFKDDSWSTRTRLEWWLLEPVLKLDGVRIVDHYTAYVDASRAQGVPSAQEALSCVGLSFRTILEKRTRFLSALLLTLPNSTIPWVIVERARRRLTASKLALRLYQDDHGHLPATLDELLPDYLPFVPVDPTSAEGESILYVSDGPDPHVGFRRHPDGGPLHVSLVGRLCVEGATPASQPASEQSDDQRDPVKDQPRQAADNHDPDDQP